MARNPTSTPETGVPDAAAGDPQIVEAAPTPSAPQPAAPEMKIHRSAASTTYVGIAVGLVVLVIVLIFIIQNLHNVTVHFITADFSLPVGVVILAATVAGGLLVLLASAARVLQIRRAASKHRKADARAASH